MRDAAECLAGARGRTPWGARGCPEPGEPTPERRAGRGSISVWGCPGRRTRSSTAEALGERGAGGAASSVAQRLRRAPVGRWARRGLSSPPWRHLTWDGGAPPRRLRFSPRMWPGGRVSSSGNPRCGTGRPAAVGLTALSVR